MRYTSGFSGLATKSADRRPTPRQWLTLRLSSYLGKRVFASTPGVFSHAGRRWEGGAGGSCLAGGLTSPELNGRRPDREEGRAKSHAPPGCRHGGTASSSVAPGGRKEGPLELPKVFRDAPDCLLPTSLLPRGRSGLLSGSDAMRGGVFVCLIIPSLCRPLCLGRRVSYINVWSGALFRLQHAPLCPHPRPLPAYG